MRVSSALPCILLAAFVGGCATGRSAPAPAFRGLAFEVADEPRDVPDRAWPASNVSSVIGVRGAKNDDDSDVGGVAGVEVSHLFDNDLGIEGGATYSRHDEFLELWDDDEDLRVWDVYVGGRYALSRGTLTPYLGAGVSYLALDGRGADDGVGGYAHVGVSLLVADHFTIGFDVRGVLGSEDEMKRYFQAAFLIGFSF